MVLRIESRLILSKVSKGLVRICLKLLVHGVIAISHQSVSCFATHAITRSLVETVKEHNAIPLAPIIITIEKEREK